MARHNNNFDGWPAVSNSACELHPIHAPWHVYVGEHDPYIATSLQDSDRLICISCFYDLKAGILDEMDREHADEWLVLDDEHQAFASSRIFVHRT